MCGAKHRATAVAKSYYSFSDRPKGLESVTALQRASRRPSHICSLNQYPACASLAIVERGGIVQGAGTSRTLLMTEVSPSIISICAALRVGASCHRLSAVFQAFSRAVARSHAATVFSRLDSAGRASPSKRTLSVFFCDLYQRVHGAIQSRVVSILRTPVLRNGTCRIARRDDRERKVMVNVSVHARKGELNTCYIGLITNSEHRSPTSRPRIACEASIQG